MDFIRPHREAEADVRRFGEGQLKAVSLPSLPMVEGEVGRLDRGARPLRGEGRLHADASIGIIRDVAEQTLNHRAREHVHVVPEIRGRPDVAEAPRHGARVGALQHRALQQRIAGVAEPGLEIRQCQMAEIAAEDVAHRPFPRHPVGRLAQYAAERESDTLERPLREVQGLQRLLGRREACVDRQEHAVHPCVVMHAAVAALLEVQAEVTAILHPQPLAHRALNLVHLRPVAVRTGGVAGAARQVHRRAVGGAGIGGLLRAAAAVVPDRVGRQRVDVALVEPVVVGIEALPHPLGVQFQRRQQQPLHRRVGRRAPVPDRLIKELCLHIVHREPAVERALPVEPRAGSLVAKQPVRAGLRPRADGVGLLLEADRVLRVAPHPVVPAQRRGPADHAPPHEADVERHAPVPENSGVPLAIAVHRMTHRRHRRIQPRVRRRGHDPLNRVQVGQPVTKGPGRFTAGQIRPGDGSGGHGLHREMPFVLAGRKLRRAHHHGQRPGQRFEQRQGISRRGGVTHPHHSGTIQLAQRNLCRAGCRGQLKGPAVHCGHVAGAKFRLPPLVQQRPARIARPADIRVSAHDGVPFPAGILLRLRTAEGPDEPVTGLQARRVEPDRKPRGLPQRHHGDGELHAREGGIRTHPGHPAAAIAGLDPGKPVQPLRPALPREGSHEGAVQEGLRDQPHERPVAREDSAFRVLVAVKRAVVEIRAVAPDDLAVRRAVAQPARAKILRGDRLARFTPRARRGGRGIGGCCEGGRRTAHGVQAPSTNRWTIRMKLAGYSQYVLMR